MGQLDGKVGIITGAASGIGASCARILAHEGATLVLTDVD
jgi:NAD(P)-dependent dehydrogenase (short-subunit alcohol dehydrogenase family)